MYFSELRGFARLLRGFARLWQPKHPRGLLKSGLIREKGGRSLCYVLNWMKGREKPWHTSRRKGSHTRYRLCPEMSGNDKMESAREQTD